MKEIEISAILINGEAPVAIFVARQREDDILSVIYFIGCICCDAGKEIVCVSFHCDCGTCEDRFKSETVRVQSRSSVP